MAHAAVALSRPTAPDGSWTEGGRSRRRTPPRHNRPSRTTDYPTGRTVRSHVNEVATELGSRLAYGQRRRHHLGEALIDHPGRFGSVEALGLPLQSPMDRQLLRTGVGHQSQVGQLAHREPYVLGDLLGVGSGGT